MDNPRLIRESSSAIRHQFKSYCADFASSCHCHFLYLIPLSRSQKAALIWLAASDGIPPNSTEMPGGFSFLSTADSFRLLIANPAIRCTMVSAGMSAGFPIVTAVPVSTSARNKYYYTSHGVATRTFDKRMRIQKLLRRAGDCLIDAQRFAIFL